MLSSSPLPTVFDAALPRHQSNIPSQFIWPEEEKPCHAEELEVPVIDLAGFLSGDVNVASDIVKQVTDACESHGFFLVVNHGIPTKLIAETHKRVHEFFSLPLGEKQRAQRKPGESCGYASSFIGRFTSKLPWKETLSFRYSADPHLSFNTVEDYFASVLGDKFRDTG